MSADAAASAVVGYEQLNRYSRIIVDEALSRGVSVDMLDPGTGEMLLTHGGRTVATIQSLSELTSAVALRRCDDKWHTRQVLGRAGLRLAVGRLATFDQADVAFLKEHGELVVKPCRGEQGWGITVGVSTATELEQACRAALAYSSSVLLEQRCEGDDLRILVIDGALVAAAIRRPATIIGDGRLNIARLIEQLSAERAESTGVSIPINDVTLSVVAAGGHRLDDVLAEGERLAIRRTANLHTGGTLEDVTDVVHPELVDAAINATIAIDIPVAGVDLMVPDPTEPFHHLIEVNEQPGLANHGRRPTAERFLDLLFPATAHQ